MNSHIERSGAQPVDLTSNTFSHELVVNDAHIDRFGHANNVAFVQWIQDVAEAHSDAVGFPVSTYEKRGAAFVVRRHEIDYLRPALRGERLTLTTHVPSAKGVSCNRATEITSADGHVVARAMTTWVFADLATLRLSRIPDDIRIAFGFVARRAVDVTSAARSAP